MDPASPQPTETKPPAPAEPPKPKNPPTKLIVVGVIVVAIVLIGGYLYIKSLGEVVTDDAYVNGHVTYIAPRVGGQVMRVLVEDNNRVRKGDVLVELDPEPYQIQVDIAQAAVSTAESDVAVAQAQARSTTGQTRSLRFGLQHAIEEVDSKIAQLHSRIATLQSQVATLNKAQADYDRAIPLVSASALTKEEFDLRKQSLEIAKAKVEEATQAIYELRTSLGIVPKPESGDLAEVPGDLDQTFSTVLQAQASLIQSASVVGITDSFTKSPRQMVADFYKRDPEGNVDRIYESVLKNAPGVKQAEAKLMQAQKYLEQAKLNLKYTKIVSETDGVVTRREVNPGNNLASGQGIMAIRSLTDIWVDANFKETQLGSLRIGQPVDIDVDMYGSDQVFKGHISGFTFGTGSSLALLPAENATGNFVKVVQRLPVRIELDNYDSEKTPLFIGLSVTPRVRIKETPTGPNAGAILQPLSNVTEKNQ